MQQTLLHDIEAFLVETGITDATFGRAIGNGRLLDRLRAGATPIKGKPTRVWPETEVQIRAFMMSERQRRQVAA
jgi:hypothetical protein